MLEGVVLVDLGCHGAVSFHSRLAVELVRNNFHALLE